MKLCNIPGIVAIAFSGNLYVNNVTGNYTFRKYHFTFYPAKSRSTICNTFYGYLLMYLFLIPGHATKIQYLRKRNVQQAGIFKIPTTILPDYNNFMCIVQLSTHHNAQIINPLSQRRCIKQKHVVSCLSLCAQEIFNHITLLIVQIKIDNI